MVAASLFVTAVAFAKGGGGGGGHASAGGHASVSAHPVASAHPAAVAEAHPTPRASLGGRPFLWFGGSAKSCDKAKQDCN